MDLYSSKKKCRHNHIKICPPGIAYPILAKLDIAISLKQGLNKY